MSDPTVSVIIPAYNSAHTLSRALDSVLRQSVSADELIVIDDGSQDNLEAAVKPYGSRVQLLRQENAGPAAARNNGARRASGELLAFLDADDFWHSRKLEVQLIAFRQRPDITLCWTRGKTWSGAIPADDPAELNPELTKPPYITQFTEIFRAPYLGTPGVMMPKEVFLRLGGFREDLQSAEDVDLWLRASYGKVTARIPAQLFYIVSSPTSLTQTAKGKVFESNLRVIEDFCRTHPDFLRAERATVKRARAKVYENWGSGALVGGDLPQARNLLLRSLRDRISLRAVMLLSKVVLRGGLS
jgi:glycosyltransferase involved in cell wall biosynthesis